MMLPQPANLEIEQSLIGAVLVNFEAMRFVDGIVRQEDFYERIHQEIWRILVDLYVAGKKADLRLVVAALGDIAEVNLLRGFGQLTAGQYVARLAAEATSVIMAADYAQTVRDLADQRRIADVGASLRHENPEDPDALAVAGIDALDQIMVVV